MGQHRTRALVGSHLGAGRLPRPVRGQCSGVGSAGLRPVPLSSFPAPRPPASGQTVPLGPAPGQPLGVTLGAELSPHKSERIRGDRSRPSLGGHGPGAGGHGIGGADRGTGRGLEGMGLGGRQGMGWGLGGMGLGGRRGHGPGAGGHGIRGTDRGTGRGPGGVGCGIGVEGTGARDQLLLCAEGLVSGRFQGP